MQPTDLSPAIANSSTTTKVVVATTVALTFITFWEAASVVLNDIASTMYYIGGITEQAIGKPAPWMVLAVMLFSYAVRSVYMESCGMFVRGGVYIVVKDSIGPTVAKLSVSSLVVDYVAAKDLASLEGSSEPILIAAAAIESGRSLQDLFANPLTPGAKVGTGHPLFPRVETK